MNLWRRVRPFVPWVVMLLVAIADVPWAMRGFLLAAFAFWRARRFMRRHSLSVGMLRPRLRGGDRDY